MNGERAPATADLQQVFISYRREDSAAYAGRIYDAMVGRFGEDNVFMDVEMPPGVDFVERIDAVVSGCTALIVVIGPSWSGIVDGDGQPRLHDSSDFVRHEVAAALRRGDVTVIPALVGGATMPQAGHLPEDLQPLARRNALELSDGRWHYDVGRLNTTLDSVIGPAPVPVPEPRPAPAPMPVPDSPLAALRMPLEGTLVGAAAAFAGRWLAELTTPTGLTDTAGSILEIVIQRATAWGLVGLALALWLGWRQGSADFVRFAVIGLLAGLLAGIVGGAIFALPHKLNEIPNEEQPVWGWLSLAATGATIGLLLGLLWRPPRLAVGLAGGLAGGLVGRLLLDQASWFSDEMPDVAFVFAILAAFIAAFALLALHPPWRVRSDT